MSCSPQEGPPLETRVGEWLGAPIYRRPSSQSGAFEEASGADDGSARRLNPLIPEKRTMPEAAYQARLERILGVPLAADAVRQWPQSGELIRGRARIAEVESHFGGLRLGVGRRHACGDKVVVEWSADYGDGRVYRNVSIAELQEGKAVRVTDYWGEPFAPPAWRQTLADQLEMPPTGTWPAADALTQD